MEKQRCALGCPPANNLYIFPNRKTDNKRYIISVSSSYSYDFLLKFRRRNLWLDFFDIEEPNIGSIFACNRHFSYLQTTKKGLRTDAVPDIP